MQDSFSKLPGVGPALSEKLQKAGFEDIAGLVNNFPRTYHDESNMVSLGSAQMGQLTAKVQFTSVNTRRSKSGMLVTEAIASDSTGSVKVVWFRQPYRAAQLKAEQWFYMSGELAYKQGRVSVVSPSIEPAEAQPLHTARIVPIYRESAGLNSRQLRKIIKSALQLTKMPESLPRWLIEEYDLMGLTEAFEQIHFPDDTPSLEAARRRLGFEELLGFMLATALSRAEFEQEKAPKIDFVESVARSLSSSLPFELTNAQRKVAWQMLQDIEKEVPANRLIEGDVGSGKTVVAAMVCAMALKQGYQAAFMAPTELLARQHAESLRSLLRAVGQSDSVGLLVGSMGSKLKKQAQAAIEDGRIKLAVGTHALIQESTKFQNLGLVVVDEQHRFGVQQRKKLEAKTDLMPHSFYLTATPIPRSLALTLYGEMDVSVIDEKPPGRKQVDTSVKNVEAFSEVIRQINEVAKSGRQVFVVCPLISKKDSPKDLTSAENMFEFLSSKLKGCNVGLLHGKMKVEDKEQTMQSLLAGETQVLVATTVIEVGVDVPNADLMVIMGADKFGLAQLHQLRGRVGRANQEAQCILVSTSDGPVKRRLQIMSRVYDGFKLAEYDLETRGPGAIYGTLQHGALDLKIAKLTDTKLIAEARTAAGKFINSEDISNWKHLLKRTELIRSVTYLN